MEKLFCADFMKEISDNPIAYQIQKEKDIIENAIREAAIKRKKEKEFLKPFFEVNKEWLKSLNFKIEEKIISTSLHNIYTIKISWP
jgi:hypothetical protein